MTVGGLQFSCLVLVHSSLLITRVHGSYVNGKDVAGGPSADETTQPLARFGSATFRCMDIAARQRQ